MTHHDPESTVATEFARYRDAVAGAVPAAGTDAVFAAARTRTRRRHAATAVAAAAAVAAVLSVGTVAVRSLTAPEPISPAAPAAALPAALDVAPMPQPTGLKLLVRDWLLDIDARENHPVGVTGWLPRPGTDPLLAEWDWNEDPFTRARYTVRREPALPPHTRKVARIDRPPLGTVAASDRGGLWILDRVDDRCLLSHLDADERADRRERIVDCDLELAAATPRGLWAVEDGGEGDTVLLGGAELDEQARFAEAHPIDDDRVLVTEDGWQAMAVHDLRTGQVTPIARPPALGDRAPRVGAVSPDLRWLPLSFADPSSSPQRLDVWLLDLDTGAWLQLPSMPAPAAVKQTELAWASDGRLVMLGSFRLGDFPQTSLLLTWRPGDADLAALPYARPTPDPDDPVSYEFLVLEP